MKEAVGLVRRELKTQEFRSKGNTFYRGTQDGNTIIISLQKSTKSTPARSEVALNYGVYSALIGNKLQDEPSVAHDIMRAHWRKRLCEGDREKWIVVEAADSPDELARSIVSAIKTVLPELVAHSSNAALRDEWIAGVSPGLTDMQRLLFAAIVTHELGPAPKVAEVVRELRALVAGDVQEDLIDRQLERLGIKVAK